MKTILRTMLVIGIAFVSQWSPAQAKENKEVYTYLDENNLKEMLTALAIPFERVTKDNYKIELGDYSAFAQISKDGDLYLTSYFENAGVTLEKINEHNANNRWGRVYLDKDRDLTVQTELSFTGGINLDGILIHINTFKVILESVNEAF